MTTTLEGVDAKVGRAQDHATELHALLTEALAPDRYSFAFDPNVQEGQHVYRVYGVPELDLKWSLLIGDCVNNLRAALDHLAWQLVKLDRKKPTNKTYFPIREAPFDNKGNILTAPQLHPRVDRTDILEALEHVQPYYGPGGRLVDSHENYLWILKELCNTDKHRLLLVVACVFNFGHMWWGSDPSVPSPDLKVNTRPLNNGAPVAWFDFHGGGPPNDFDPHPSLQLAIREEAARGYWHHSVTNTLELLIYWVKDEIINYRFKGLFSDPPRPMRPF